MPVSTPTAVVSPPKPRFVTDDKGRAVTLLATPKRIVSIGPEVTEVLVALGAIARIVGVDNWSQLPQEAGSVIRLGDPYLAGDVISDQMGINVDALKALRPDIVIADARVWERAPAGGSYPRTACPLPSLEGSDIPMACILPADSKAVTQTFSSILWLGQLIGEGERARILFEGFEQQQQAVTRAVGNLNKTRVLFLAQCNHPPGDRAAPVTEAAKLTFNELLQLAGGTNVFTAGPEGQITAEVWRDKDAMIKLYVAKNPEVVLVLGDWTHLYSYGPQWNQIEAVKRGRVHLMGCGLTPLTLIDRLQQLARWLHPDAFLQ
jgi:iron complex transport system substrate-binding protein